MYAKKRTIHTASILLWLLGLAWFASIDDPRLRFPEAMASELLMSGGWLVLVLSASKDQVDGKVLKWIIVLGVTARVALLWMPPAFSDDVFRYVYEGRVVWYKGPGFPFAHAPAEAPAITGIPSALFDESWLRINHPAIPTIYPPLSQLAFAGAGGLGDLLGGGHLFILKSFLVVFDLGTWTLCAATLRRAGRSTALAWVFAMCPLVLIEVAREGHGDSLSMLGLALAGYAFVVQRPVLGYTGFALAALAKLNGLIVLPAALRTTRRGFLTGALLTTLLSLPFWFAGLDASQALFSYATRWRSGDGVFSLILAVSEAIVGGEWTRIGPWTITRHLVARMLTGLSFLGFATVLLWRPAPLAEVPRRAGLILLALLLLSPSLHPWYVLWVLPFSALYSGRIRSAGVVFAILAPFLHHPGWIELTRGTWTDLPWIRAVVHGAVWLAICLG
ncbi:MAG: hypothetical protein IPK13_15305 [Deltaproteobacteria bacterium]|nr:hypothetical protein [Deltaproteobacteria bacterium]